MKDKTRHNHVKKPSHRLKRACILLSAFTLCCSALASVALLHYTNENATLSAKIDNYNVQINLLEDEAETRLRQGEK
ncbi:MAG: hypothetical protein IJ194_02715 [Bacilli bacterium]|jgi:hypothetical protein|nr:hypothetical protein [Bacilli bacterium]